MRSRLTAKASQDIDDIIRYTDENFGEAQTAEYVGGLYRSFQLLEDNPQMGQRWAQGRRCYIFRQHYVFYRISEDELIITHIRNTRMALPRD